MSGRATSITSYMVGGDSEKKRRTKVDETPETKDDSSARRLRKLGSFDNSTTKAPATNNGKEAKTENDSLVAKNDLNGSSHDADKSGDLDRSEDNQSNRSTDDGKKRRVVETQDSPDSQNRLSRKQNPTSKRQRKTIHDSDDEDSTLVRSSSSKTRDGGGVAVRDESLRQTDNGSKNDEIMIVTAGSGDQTSQSKKVALKKNSDGASISSSPAAVTQEAVTFQVAPQAFASAGKQQESKAGPQGGKSSPRSSRSTDVQASRVKQEKSNAPKSSVAAPPQQRIAPINTPAVSGDQISSKPVVPLGVSTQEKVVLGTLEQMCKIFRNDSMFQLISIGSNVDLHGSFLRQADMNKYDYFDTNDNGDIILQPRLPVFPEEFPAGMTEHSLSWWGILDPALGDGKFRPSPKGASGDVRKAPETSHSSATASRTRKEGGGDMPPPDRQPPHPDRRRSNASDNAPVGGWKPEDGPSSGWRPDDGPPRWGPEDRPPHGWGPEDRPPHGWGRYDRPPWDANGPPPPHWRGGGYPYPPDYYGFPDGPYGPGPFFREGPYGPGPPRGGPEYWDGPHGRGGPPGPSDDRRDGPQGRGGPSNRSRERPGDTSRRSADGARDRDRSNSRGRGPPPSPRQDGAEGSSRSGRRQGGSRRSADEGGNRDRSGSDGHGPSTPQLDGADPSSRDNRRQAGPQRHTGRR